MTSSSQPPADHAACLARARLSLEGLSLGDSFGQRFFYQSTFNFLLKEKALPRPPWLYTDDTMMAIAIYETLDRDGRIDQDWLAERFANRYQWEPSRGYARGAVELLSGVLRGESWRDLSSALFYGQGSMGNGSAMRVAPLGAYFADDVELLIEQAAASAEVTHAHPDGRAGAIAVALAAAYAWQHRNEVTGGADGLIAFVLERTPPGKTADGLQRAVRIPLEMSVVTAARALGNGEYVTCADTVPFCVWSAAKELKNFERALWNTVSVYGDMDTTCAIVGGIVALSVGQAALPGEWLQAREPLGL